LRACQGDLLSDSVRETPVLIVGAGPVGLALACELRYRGVQCVIIDQGFGEVLFPAGEAIFVRTMEHLRRWGIADDVYATPFPQRYPRDIIFVTRLMGFEVARYPRESNLDARENAGEFSPEAGAWCPKMWFDPILRAYAVGSGRSELRYGCRLERFEQHRDGVRASVVDLKTGAESIIDCSYLVACDGAKSNTRRALNIPFEGVFAEGHNLGIYFEAPGLIGRQPHGAACHFQTLTTRYRSVLSSVDGADLWRLSFSVSPEEAASLDVDGSLRDALGADVKYEILRAQPWAGHRVVARSYRNERVFLAGDAAHMLWPYGGFGANTGIGDAVDLGWKLAGVIEGWGGEGLLQSYEAERRPIGLRNVEEAASNNVAYTALPNDPVLEDAGPRGAARRAEVGDQIRLTRFKEWSTLGIQLGYRYDRSPVIPREDTPEPPDEPTTYVPSTWPGCRAPHAWEGPGHSTLDRYGHRFVLVAREPEGFTAFEQAAADAGVPLEVVQLEANTPVYPSALTLVRPDGHVAWRGARVPRDAAALLRYVAGRAPFTGALAGLAATEQTS
jgi:2-polyprenyl-6-methoxyphenol hydroxylase-like FAD-dependent oxidoreductase